MDVYSVIFRKTESSKFRVRYFYDFDRACDFASDVCMKGFDHADVLKVLREYYFDQAMVEYFQYEV